MIKLTFGEVKGVFKATMPAGRQMPETNASLLLVGPFSHIQLSTQGQAGVKHAQHTISE